MIDNDIKTIRHATQTQAKVSLRLQAGDSAPVCTTDGFSQLSLVLNLQFTRPSRSPKMYRKKETATGEVLIYFDDCRRKISTVDVLYDVTAVLSVSTPDLYFLHDSCC